MKEILSIKQLLDGYKEKEYSPKEVIEHFYNKSKSLQSKLNHYITLRDNLGNIPDKAIPIAHKDIFSTKGMETAAASNILKGYIPPFSATVVKKLEDKNFYSLGKLNCDAFAHGGTGENSDFGPVRNPWDLNKVSGGSSSGSAAAVASLSVLAATATDTGGSVRNPASFTGTVGLKPTYGRVSRYGIISMTSSTDSIGHITRTVWDSAYILNITAGRDKMDATSSNEVVPDYTKGLESYKVEGLKVGMPKEYFDNSIDSKIRDKVLESIKILESKGAKIIDIDLPHTEYGVATYYIITLSEISSNLARFDGIRYGHTRDKFGDEAVRRIMLGTFALSSGYYYAYYKKAQMARNAISMDFEDAFKKVDIIAGPITPHMPPKIGEIVDDPLKNYLMDVLTVPVNLAGLPALSVPTEAKEMPVGIQFIGPKFSEHLLFKVGNIIEQETEYYKNLPNLVVSSR